MRLIRTALCAVLVMCPSILSAQSFTGTITGTIKDTSGGPGAPRYRHDYESADRPAGVGGHRSRGPVYLVAADSGGIPGGRGTPGLPPRRTHGYSGPDQRDDRH